MSEENKGAGSAAAGDSTAQSRKRLDDIEKSAAEPIIPSTELGEASRDLKERIDEAKRRNAMPLDSNLGNPDWERKAADGHLDRPDEEDDA